MPTPEALPHTSTGRRFNGNQGARHPSSTTEASPPVGIWVPWCVSCMFPATGSSLSCLLSPLARPCSVGLAWGPTPRSSHHTGHTCISSHRTYQNLQCVVGYPTSVHTAGTGECTILLCKKCPVHMDTAAPKDLKQHEVTQTAVITSTR
jgi:hypothetical protein